MAQVNNAAEDEFFAVEGRPAVAAIDFDAVIDPLNQEIARLMAVVDELRDLKRMQEARLLAKRPCASEYASGAQH